MRKLLRVVRNIFLVLLACIILFVSGAFVYHRIKLSQEKPLLENVPGQMVEVDGHNMHVYSEGQGDHTIVFLSGWGTTSPYQDFLPMTKELSGENKVVIIEKFGYGYSDEVPGEREAYVASEKKEKLVYSGFNILCKLGIMRVLVGTPEFETEDDKIRYALEQKEGMNKNFISENSNTVESIDEILTMPLPTTPTLQFVSKQTNEISNREFPGTDWMAAHQELVDASVNGKLVELESSHYVYRYEQDTIVSGIKEFLKTLC
ncbi:alpha/beta hydrolase [Butyrivibrio sp. X503]|uniref:alpha/beta fold hydrolase n=1 Tax=Butyrivibrio sp. X503 TaxID=2364878 RepID=UPI000EA93107|nr:alpha/beta hydrolase [Butyrivibrio sp. X503]RKM55572.1 alpha/beta hydrolase [Butyrivibrio sp. X503]